MLSAFRAQPLYELKQQDKSKIEAVLAYGMAHGFSYTAMSYIIHFGH